MIEGFERLVKEATEASLRISTAESCTGGLISSSITDVPGASECYLGGIVAYSDRLKEDILGVNQSTLETKGAVSRETALEMVKGCLEVTGSDAAVSVTGIAGPAGGSKEKPVGTVFVAVGSGDKIAICEGFLLKDLSRSEFKAEVAKRALGMLTGLVGDLSREIEKEE